MNTLKEKIEILEAMERGEVIQFSETDGEVEEDWEDLKTSELDFDFYTYRLKPNSRLEVGDKPALMTTNEKIEVIRAYDNGEDIEYTSIDSVVEEFWGNLLSPEFDFSRFKYRVKGKDDVKGGDDNG